MSYSRYHAVHASSNLTVLAFDNDTQAFQLRDALFKLEGESLFHLDEAIVVTRDQAGQVRLHQPALDNAVGGAGLGLLLGAIVGALFIVPGLGTAVGAGVGAMTALLADIGIDDRFMKELGATLRPGTSALFLLGRQAQLDELGQRLGPLLNGSTLLHTTVDTQRESDIRKLLQTQTT